MSNARRVCIIGAGSAGLAAALCRVLEPEQGIIVHVEDPELPRGDHLFEIHAPPEMPEFTLLAAPSRGPRRVRGRGKKAWRASL